MYLIEKDRDRRDDIYSQEEQQRNFVYFMMMDQIIHSCGR